MLKIGLLENSGQITKKSAFSVKYTDYFYYVMEDRKNS